MLIKSDNIESCSPAFPSNISAVGIYLFSSLIYASLLQKIMTGISIYFSFAMIVAVPKISFSSSCPITLIMDKSRFLFFDMESIIIKSEKMFLISLLTYCPPNVALTPIT